MISKLICSIVLGSAFMLAGQGVANAQATRTWVSGVGDDVNPCSRTAPCKTFAGAISKTAAGGEISVMDPGGFGAVTITKSMSLVAEGTEGSITACNTNGIVINAGVNDIVSIHGVLIEGCGNGLYGIRVIQAKAVHIRHCQIRGFLAASAIAVRVEGAAKVFIEDCDISKNGRGVTAIDTSEVYLNRVSVNNNNVYGVRSNMATASVVLNRSTLTGNEQAIGNGAGPVISYGNNVITGNVSLETPDQTKSLK